MSTYTILLSLADCDADLRVVDVTGENSAMLAVALEEDVGSNDAPPADRLLQALEAPRHEYHVLGLQYEIVGSVVPLAVGSLAGFGMAQLAAVGSAMAVSLLDFASDGVDVCSVKRFRVQLLGYTSTGSS